ncbi:carboxypeptidase-like regulatory domain-containing protein [Algoriphagus aestuarii]|nr:carboxypeptidase-like regulatory domain-containing protein [Algoriphagus aestuarii]
MVLSQDKKPIPGAIIIVKETTTGTVTDIKGNFSLDLKSFEEENLTLKISMIDYESTEVIVKKSELPLNVGKITLNKEAE